MIEFSFQGPTTLTSKEDTFSVDTLSFLIEHTSGRFYRKFVDSGMALDAGVSMVTSSITSEVSVSALTTADNFKKLKPQLLEEMKKWSSADYFTQTELNDVKRKMRIAHLRELNQPSEFGKNLAFWWAVAGLEYYNSYFDSLDKVSLQDVSSVVKKYLSSPYLTSILTSPAEAKRAGLKPNFQELEKTYGLYR
jgi:zinc protease